MSCLSIRMPCRHDTASRRGYPRASLGTSLKDLHVDTGANNDRFQSMHPGGVHFLHTDGRIRFVTEFLDRDLPDSLTARHGQEVVEDAP